MLQTYTMDCHAPKVTLLLTRLGFADYTSNKKYILEWAVQRILFYRHEGGVDSHLSLLFTNRTDQMLLYASQNHRSSSQLARNTRTVVWEIVQKGDSGFRTIQEMWACKWSRPSTIAYEFTCKDQAFVACMHSTCVDFVVSDEINYGENLRYNATFCRWYPHHCCENSDAVNCVTATLLVIASALENNSTLATQFEWNTAQIVLSSNAILAAHTPYNAVKMLAASKAIQPETTSMTYAREANNMLPTLTLVTY